MRAMRIVVLVVLLGGFVSASAQSEGVLPSWEVEEMAAQLGKTAGKVRQILDEVRPKEWIQDGAPAAYVAQYDELLSDMNSLEGSAQAMARYPEKLTVVVDTFLWLDRLHSMLGSMIQGVRGYQSPAIADLLESARGDNAEVVAKLKEYMRQIAAMTEAEMEIAHREAQRCRGAIARRPRR